MNYKRLFIENSYVFLTVVTYKRKKILVNNIEKLRESFLEAKKHFEYRIIANVILQDHFHILIQPKEIQNYPLIIKAIKYNFSSKLTSVGLASPTYGYENKREKGIWQRRYIEHTIRDEDDLNRHIDYIHFNPMKHYNIAPKDWEHSSFNKFFQADLYDLNWCNYGDNYKINELDYE